MKIGLIAVYGLLATVAVWADAMKSVDFTAPGGVKCRLTAEGASMWRIRTARADGTFAEVGAAQSLAARPLDGRDAASCAASPARDG